MPPPSTQRRRGFTLIELLVVISIIAILIGMLLPAVQKVRESAARTKCGNNLHNIAIAAHLYQDTNKELPPGWLTSVDATVAPSPGWSWASLILPYIEQKGLYDNVQNTNTPAPQYGVTVNPISGPAAPTAANYLQTKINIYRCPSDIKEDTNSQFQNYSTSNYVCNRAVMGPGRTTGTNERNPLSVEKIRDGASNTILFGEREGIVNVAAVWVRSSASSASFEGRAGKGLNPQPAPGARIWNVSPNNDSQRLAYSSPHQGGVQFAMGDGRVIFVRDTIDFDATVDWTVFPVGVTNYTLQKLENPNDRLPVVIE